MDSLRQLSESTRLDGVLSIFEISDGAFGNAGFAPETFSRKSHYLRPLFDASVLSSRQTRTGLVLAVTAIRQVAHCFTAG